MAGFKPSYEGIGRMLTSEGMQVAMRALAEKVKERAEATAPVDTGGPHPGRYKAAFSTSSGVRHAPTSRAYGRVSNGAPEAFFVEYGTKNNPKHRTLGKALDAVKE